MQALLDSAPERVTSLLISSDRRDQRVQNISARAEARGLPLRHVNRAELDRLCAGRHQGVIAYAAPAPRLDERALLECVGERGAAAFVLALDGVTDPHNLGACLRSADAAGVDAVIAPKDKAAGLTDVARKVACGAAESVPFVSVTNLSRTLKQLQAAGLWVVGTSGEATASIYRVPLTGPLVLVMGAEGKGIRRLTRETCDHLAYIPMAGSVASLNVSVATGVCLFEALRQRREKVEPI